MIARNILITEVSYEPVTDKQAIDHLREDDSALPRVKAYLAAARVSVEQEMITTKTTQATYELQVDDWTTAMGSDGYIILPACPIVSIVSVKYDDVNNVEQTLASSNYQADTSSRPGRIRYTASASLPSVYDKPNAVRIRYIAGYGASGATDGGQSSVPQPIKSAVLLRLAELYETRTESVSGMISPASLTVLRLIAPYRIPC